MTSSRLPSPDTAEPPFFRGEKGGHDAPWCDYLAVGECCDDPSKYLIEWQPQDYDAGTIPVSGACEQHALKVDRRLVARMSTHERTVTHA